MTKPAAGGDPAGGGKTTLKNLRIAISGKSGCGNTTVSRLVAEQLEVKFINFTFRSLAEERGLSLETILRLAGEDDTWDREVDTRQVALARESKGCVLGSRLAIWMLTEADIKVYLKASPEVRVSRILNREGGDREAIEKFTQKRDGEDRARYLKLYNIDNDIYDFADMVIDTDTISPQEIASLIIAKAEARVNGQG